uniref:Reverse transcriptase domain-containing protein n=1 Tax=Tanacetum cinerariifolium TaxID=118510 RepID=A0A6L2LTD6_TANCI|nr:reverse transcriptase domain-containing protein [Tanacetum cinerariifolium]
MVRTNGQAPRMMGKLCQLSINGRGGPIAPIPIQAIDFGLRQHMIQQVQNTYQFHELPGDDANRHIDKFLEITQHMKQNRVSDDALPSRDETSRNISSTSTTENPEVVRQLEMMNKNFLEMIRQIKTIKAVDTKCETFGGPHSVIECPAINRYTQETAYATTGSFPSNTVPNPQADLKAIATQSGVTLAGPSVSLPSKEVDQEPEMITDQVLTESTNNFYWSSSRLPFLLHVLLFLLLRCPRELFDLATTPVNENYSAVILKKLPEKLGDPGKFLIPCDFVKFDECLALADLGTSINLMPLSIWKKLSLPELSSTQMILELADRSTTRPAGITEDIFIKVGKFYFPTDSVVVDYVFDPRVPLILGRPFLRTRHALIDFYAEELTLRVDDEAITFKVGQTSKYSYNDAESINRIDVIDIACEECVQERRLFLEEIEACLRSKSIPRRINDTDLDLEGDIRLLEEMLNNDPSLSHLPPKELNNEEIKTIKSSIDEPPELELKELPLWISPVHCVPKKGGTFQMCMMAIFHDMIEKTIEVFMDDFLVFGDSFSLCLSHLVKMLQRCEDTNLVLNWEKCHFMVKEGIVLGHKISKSGIEVNRAKVDVIAKLPHLTSVRVLSKTIVYTDHSALKYLLAKQDGAKNLAAVHLSRLENPHQDELEKKEIIETFLLKALGENRASWFDKLDDALWDFRTAFKTPIWCTPYKLVYGKACHLPIELEHKAYWASKHCNFDLKTARDHQKVQLNELNEFRDQAYENYLIYKEKTKKIHDSKIKTCVFNVGDRVLLFNSRLKIFLGKFKTRWTGPFTVANVFPYGTIELSQADGPNFKVNGHRLKHYFRGIAPDLEASCARSFVHRLLELQSLAYGNPIS